MISLNSNIGGNGYTITAVNPDTVTISNGSVTQDVSICNIKQINFDSDIALTPQTALYTPTTTPPATPGNLDYCGLLGVAPTGPAPICCCNAGIGTSISAKKPSKIEVVDNNNDPTNVKTYLAICSDMVWVEQGTGTSS